VLPYRSATQSGVSAIACHFQVPMLVTAVGGLKAEVGDTGTGIVASSPDPDVVRAEILRFFADDSIRERCVKAMVRQGKLLSWSSYAMALTEFAKTL
jgi:glycosyltransferase involved in cell wall biosynthesis